MQRTTAVGLLGSLLSPEALAHSSVPGMKGFWAGLLHPFSTPEQLLALLALGMMLGLRWPDWFKAPAFAFASSMLLGMLLGQLGIAQEITASALLLVAVAAAMLSALYPSGLFALFVILPGIAGACIGLLSTPDPGALTATIVSLFGSFVGASLALLYISGGVAAFRERFKAQWSRIGLRVLAAWIATISILMAALSFVDQGAVALPIQTSPESDGLPLYPLNCPPACFSERLVALDAAVVNAAGPP